MGPMDFFGDSESIKFLIKNRLYGLYSKVFELDSLHQKINTKLFWASGKFRAMQAAMEAYFTSSIVSVDTDLILKLPLDFPRADVVALHYDNPNFYPVVSQRMQPEFRGWDFSPRPVNAGILAFRDRSFLKSYLDSTEIIMVEVSKWDNPDSASMIFTEQKWVSVLAKRLKKSLKVLEKVDEFTNFHVYSDNLIHVWDYKGIMRSDSSVRVPFIDLLLRMLEGFEMQLADDWVRFYGTLEHNE